MIDLDVITIEWSAGDVKEQCQWLTNEQAVDVLQAMKNNHDACVGISWDVIFYTAQAMYPQGESNE